MAKAQQEIVQEINAKKFQISKDFKEFRFTKIVSKYSVNRDLTSGQNGKIKSKILIDSEENEEVCTGRQIFEEEIPELRINKVSAILIKHTPSPEVPAEYFYIPLPKGISLLGSSFMGTHICSAVNSECYKLSPASDECGGCAKVRDLGAGKNLEKYTFVLSGWQTLNIAERAFCVTECANWTKSPKPESYKKRDREMNNLIDLRTAIFSHAGE